MISKNNTNEIHITRLYEAPLKTVWEAWSDTDQVAQWWGPRGFTLTTHSKDLRTGGHWTYTMHGPDGVDYPNKTQYLEVEPYTRLVYDHGGYDDRPPLFRVSVVFTDLKDKTKMNMVMTLPTPEEAQKTKDFIKKAGGNATWDRLAEYLEQQDSGNDIFIINRTFDVPIEVMFKMWTDPEHFSKWLAPTGFNMTFIRAEIKEGGKTFYSMTNGKDLTMYGRTHYLEIQEPHKLVYTQQFCDESENIARHPLAPIWPETMLTTVTFTEEGKDKTRVTVKWEVYGAATPAERDIFHNAKGSITQGWTGSFDKLEAYIAR